MHYAGGRAQDVPQDGGIFTRGPGGGAQDGIDRQHTLKEHDMQLVFTDPRVLPTSGRCMHASSSGCSVQVLLLATVRVSVSRFEKVGGFQDRQDQK